MKNVIGFVTTKTHTVSAISAFDRYKIGQNIKVSIGQVGNTESPQYASRRLLLIARPPAESRPLKATTSASKDKKLSKDGTRLISSMDDYSIGSLVTCKIKSIQAAQLNVTLATNLFGRIHITELVDDVSDLGDRKKPFKGYHIGQTVNARIIGYHDAKTHRYLAVTHQQFGTKTVVELSLKPSRLAEDGNNISSLTGLDGLVENSVVTGFVKNATEHAIWVLVAPTVMGRVPAVEVSNDDVDLVGNLTTHFIPGMALKCRILRKDVEGHSLDLSIRAVEHDGVSIDRLQAGQVMIGRIAQILPTTGLGIQLAHQLYGRAHLTDVADTYTRKMLGGCKVGQYVKCCVIDVDEDKRRVDLSLRPSRVNTSDVVVEVGNKEIQSADDIQQDTVVSGFVKNVSDKGLFVSLNRKLVARVKIGDLSDAYVKDWKSLHKVGQLVKGRIISVNHATSHIEMSLKASVVDGTSAQSGCMSFSDLSVGQKVKGAVKSIMPYGIFISLGGEESKLAGLCHITQVSDTPLKDINSLFSVGDFVKAVVLELDELKKRVSLGLKASYFDVDDLSEVDEGEEQIEDLVFESDNDGLGLDDQEHLDDEDETYENGSMALDGNEADDVEMEDIKIVSAQPAASEPNPLLAKLANVGALDVHESSFNWMMPVSEVGQQHVSTDAYGKDGDDDEVNTGKNSAKKKDKKQLRKEREEAISRQERFLLNPDRQPESTEDFERLVLGSPNSSILWIQYMAFVLQLAEVEKARAIAERALKVINFREEQEKLNVWIAYLNLENRFGTQETLNKVFEQAVSFNDPKTMYLQMVLIYARTGKTELGDEVCTTMLKRFKESSKCWTSAGLFYLQNDRADDARKLLQRSLLSLPKHKHIKTISKFAQMEFKFGEPERGRTMFEGIVSNYPKRVDLWNVFLDMEMRIGGVDTIRRLFERVIQLKVSSKKIKFFFKRYLSFEKTMGTEQGVEHVKTAAKAYVERISEK